MSKGKEKKIRDLKVRYATLISAASLIEEDLLKLGAIKRTPVLDLINEGVKLMKEKENEYL